MSKGPSLRLDRLLANLGYGSRREIGLLAKGGLIVLDGAPLRDANQRIAVTPDLSGRMDRLDGFFAVAVLAGLYLIAHHLGVV